MKKVKILIVEDNEGDRRLIREYIRDFEMLDVDLEEAPSFSAAMEKQKKETYDVILLDMRLPDAYGIELLLEIKKEFPRAGIIILTGIQDYDMAQIAVREGAQEYIVKSDITSSGLERSIRYTIERTKYYQKQLEIETAMRENEKLLKVNNRLNKILKELEKTNKQLEEFAYVATHNLRSPAVNLQSLFDMIDHEQISDDHNKMVIEKLGLTISQLNDTLQDLIDLVSIRKTSYDAKTEISLEKIFNKVLNSLNEQITKEDAVIRADFDEVEEMVYPRSHIESIMLNLISNAIKYRHPDRVPVIDIKATRDNGIINLVVKDNGIGIDLEKHREKLFKMYQRFHREKDGKGLGLYIVKSQLEVLGGSIEVESTPGEGTTFICHLHDDPEPKKEEQDE